MPRARRFRSFAGARPVVLNVSITVSTDNVVLSSLFTAGQISGNNGHVNVTISNGVIIGSTSTSTAAFLSGSGWGTGWTVDILVPSGSARIQGKGGNGGTGADRFTFAEGNCDFGGDMGGGGGGAGTTVGSGASNGGGAGTATSGGAGGAASTSGNCAPANNSVAGGSGGNALEATSGGPSLFLRPSVGATLEVWGGGGGGGGAGGAGSPTAGAGGGPGLDGAAGGGANGKPGGANGLAYSTPGAATITESGPGTIDDRGV